MNSQLQRLLAELPAGIVCDPKPVVSALAEVWDTLKGSSDEGMRADKLCGRTEELTWQAPFLTFKIERHGATVNGSTRASVHHWQIDCDAGVAEIISKKLRQLKPAAKRMDVTVPAEKILAAIQNAEESPSLKWYPDGRVRVLIGTIIPDDGYKQTVAGRRRRFRHHLENRLSEMGWDEVGTYCYKQNADS
jgi:hypothetical protein